MTSLIKEEASLEEKNHKSREKKGYDFDRNKYYFNIIIRKHLKMYQPEFLYDEGYQ